MYQPVAPRPRINPWGCDGMEGNWSADRPQAARQVGRPCRRHRHATGKHRPRQLGTYLSQRSAQAAARSLRAEESASIARHGRSGCCVGTSHRGPTSRRRHSSNTSGRSPTSRTASARSRWRCSTVTTWPGWIEALAAGGKLSQRSVQICRTVLRAALTEAVDEGRSRGRRRREWGCRARWPSR